MHIPTYEPKSSVGLGRVEQIDFDTGYALGTAYVALQVFWEPVSCMSFTRSGRGPWEISRQNPEVPTG
jgi:hypothetical protein